MRTDDRDDLVGDVADALTLDQQVQWERCARLAAGAERAQIENLRVIERVLASRPVAGPAAETVPATRFYGRAVVRHAVHALIALASLEVAATLLLLPWAWGDYISRARRGGCLHDDQVRRARRRRRPVAVGLLETAGGPVRVEPAGRTSVFPLLPPADAAWVTETGADVIVPVPGPGTDVLGVLVVGRRLDGRLVRSVDLPFLEALGAAAGLALARLQLLNAPGAGSGEAPPAEECPSADA